MNKKYLSIIVLILVIAIGIWVFGQKRTPETSEQASMLDYKNAVYSIDGTDVQLVNGYAETVIPNSSAKTITRYFGNDLVADLNGDGLNDVAFLVTHETGGSGTFYYAVAAIATDHGAVGSDGYFLGDRIAPQTINPSSNPKHVRVVVVNYADRKEGEPMTAQPSVGKSAYLKLDEHTRWGVVMPDFEGESR